jgi:hypothetical protein
MQKNGTEVPAGLKFKTSTRTGNGGACVEVAGADGRTYIRDSKDRTGPVLSFKDSDWVALLGFCKETNHAQ